MYRNKQTKSNNILKQKTMEKTKKNETIKGVDIYVCNCIGGTWRLAHMVLIETKSDYKFVEEYKKYYLNNGCFVKTEEKVYNF